MWMSEIMINNSVRNFYGLNETYFEFGKFTCK